MADKIKRRNVKDWAVTQEQIFGDGTGMVRIEKNGRAPIFMVYGADLAEEQVIDRATDAIYDAELAEATSDNARRVLREEQDVHALMSRGRQRQAAMTTDTGKKG